MRVAGGRGNHRHVALNAVDHHHRALSAAPAPGRFPLRFNQQHIINFGDTVTSSTRIGL
jgi:hypothetical protein